MVVVVAVVVVMPAVVMPSVPVPVPASSVIVAVTVAGIELGLDMRWDFFRRCLGCWRLCRHQRLEHLGEFTRVGPEAPNLDTASDRKPQFNQHPMNHGHQVGHTARRVQGGKEQTITWERANDAWETGPK